MIVGFIFGGTGWQNWGGGCVID